MIDEKDDLEQIEEETTSEELEGKQTVEDTDEGTKEVDAKDKEGAEEPQTPKAPPSDEPPELMSAMKKYAKEYGLEEQDFAKLDDPDTFAKRTMQQFKGFLDLSQRLEAASQSPLPPPLAPQDVPSQVTPSAEDGAVDDLLGDPRGFLTKFMGQRDAKQQEQAYKIEVFRQDQAINQWAGTLPPAEVAQLTPLYNNDPVIRLKRSTGQIITIQDAQAAYQNAQMVSGNIQQVRQDGFDAGAAATDDKRRAAVESGKKKSGTPTVLGLDALVEKYGVGDIPEAELNAAIAAEEAAG